MIIDLFCVKLTDQSGVYVSGVKAWQTDRKKRFSFDAPFPGESVVPIRRSSYNLRL